MAAGVCAAQKVESYTLPPDQLQRAIEYARARHILYFAGTAWGMIVLVLVLALRLAPRFRDWAEAATGRRILQAYLFAPLLLLSIDILELPVSMIGPPVVGRFTTSRSSRGGRGSGTGPRASCCSSPWPAWCCGFSTP